MTNDTRPDETIENPVAGDEEISLPDGGEPESAGPLGEEDPGKQDEAEDERIASLEKEVSDLKDRLLRAVAETENVRRRLEKDKREGTDYAITGFARDLLSVADNLARALDAAEKDEVVNKGLLTGVEMTQKELMKAFEKHGIARVDSVGQPLDPHVHQAMMEVEADEGHEAGVIVAELQPGYRIRERLLRPAMVTVAK